MMHDWGMPGLWMWVNMLLFWLVPVMLAVAAFWFILSRSGRPKEERTEEPHETQRALAILKERYARGELSREEYQQMKEDLKTP